jgi:TRAP transporter TAXI family solute receptor
VRVELRPSAGSVENLKLLADPSSDVEAAFVQAGVASSTNIAGLESLGGISYEPLWIFYRGARDLAFLNDLLGKRIAIGPEGSGTRALALQLMQAVGADSATTVFAPLGGNAAIEALQNGTVDALFLVASPEAPVVRRLIESEGIRLLSLSNAEAFARRFPYLSVLRIPHGVFDLAKKRPARDITLLAATASIVAREQLHPALAFLLLNAATEVHAASGILHGYREFPAARETEFPLSDEAQRYFKTGQPFLRRYLPYWLANLVERMLVLLLPLIAVLVPAMRILPGLWQWRVKSRVFRWYGEIKYLEAELHNDPRAERIPEMLARLDEIEQGVERTPVPRNYSDYAYNLRAHINVVRHRIERMAHAGTDGQTLEQSTVRAREN